MLRFKSILSRIVFLHIIAVVVAAVLMPLVMYWLLNSDVEGLQQNAMRAQAESLARRLTKNQSGSWSLNLTAGLRDQYSESYGRYAYTVLDDAGTVLFSSRKEREPILPIANRSADVEFPEITQGNRTISGVNLRKDLDGKTVWVQVAEDLSHRDVLIDDVVENFIPQVGWIVLPALLLLLFADLVIFRKAVQPLLRASEQAQNIGPTRTDIRLPISDIPNEIRPLVSAVNQALDRLEEGFRRQREFAADAAHELRTPLAVLRTRIETLSDKASAEALHRDIEGMTRVVGQLLDAAELETLVISPTETADLHAVCADVAEFIAPLALAQGKMISLDSTERPVVVNGSAEILRRAVRNMVENALNHTPKGTTVTIVVGEQGVVSVLDQGEGIPLVNREHIFERFWRHDRRRPGSAGLGLAIVKRIVEAHGGAIAVQNRQTGGAHFSIRLRLIEDVDREDVQEELPEVMPQPKKNETAN